MTTTLLITLSIILTLTVVRLMSKVYHLSEQLNDLEARLYGDTDEDCGDIGVMKANIDTNYDWLCERMDTKFVEKPVKKLKIN